MSVQPTPPKSVFGCLFIPLAVLVVPLVIAFSWADTLALPLDQSIPTIVAYAALALILIAFKAFVISLPIDLIRRWWWRDTIKMRQIQRERKVKPPSDPYQLVG